MAERINARKEIENLTKNAQKIERTKTMTQCNCPHTRKGDLRLLPSNKGDGNYICQECQKVVSIAPIPEEEFKKACETLERAIDVIKMTLDTTRDDDLEILEELGKTQFKIKTKLPAYFRNALKSKKNKKKKNRDYDYDNGWAPASTDR